MSAAQTGARVLVVEDEGKLAQLLTDYLQAAGYQTEVLLDPEAIQAAVEAGRVDAILLDLMLPGTSGLEICKAIRKRSQVPILMVTAKVDEVDRLVGLELGADDYICKPFSPREVVARVKAVLRRTQTTENPSDMITLDEYRLTVSFHHQEVALTAVEFQLLKPLAEKPERIFTREQLMQNMYSDHRIVNNRTIDSHIKKLRKKLSDISNGKDWVQSVYGTGYRLVL